MLACNCTAAGANGAVKVSAEEQARWLRWLIPLPKQIKIQGKLVLPASEVKLRLREGAGDVEKTAAEEIRALFKEKGNASCESGRFEILFGVCDANGKLEDVTIPEARKLADLPNSKQAYLIQPAGDDRLVLTALDERGAYYAAQTLRQLLEAGFENGKVQIPLARVTDWPDLEERGEWGGSSVNDIVWLAHHKMNLVEAHVSLGMTKDGRGTARANEEKIELARRHALKLVPIITHLDQLGRTGIYDMFPELQGKGEHAHHKTHTNVAPCFSQPKMVEILSDWMCSLAAQKGVTDICAWLSECNQYCSCENCRKVGQWALEARSIVKAYRIAKKKHPNLHLRILLTQGSYKTNDKVLAEVPEDVGVTYYDGGRTYDSSRDPMIYPLLERYAAKGGWLGCYPQLTASWRIVCPWSGPQFINYRMTEFVRKKLKCLCGYATPNNRLYDFNVTAAAEWSWNSTGRDEREFATAWATRRGIKDPDAAAEWAVMLGPVGWDVYGSRVPFNHFFGSAAAMVAARRRPVLGEGMFRYFPTVEHMEHDLDVCKKAMAIAEKLDEPLLILETKVIGGYVRMIREIYRIADMVSKSKRPNHDERVKLQKAMTSLSIAGMETAMALKEWEALIGQGIGGSRLTDTVDVTEKTVVGIGDALAPLGILNPLKPYLRCEIGGWVTEDFDKKTRITKKFDVTDYVKTAGDYEVAFKYTKGWWGLSIFRVALASAPADKPDQLTELSVDEHKGSAAARNKDNVYLVTLKKYDPDVRYFVVADIRGTCSVGKPANRRGCNGTVSMKARLPKDWKDKLGKARPLSDDEMLQRNKPKFTGKGLRVGVAQAGYGSGSILALLRSASGMDAQPLAALYPDEFKACQVIVLPQPRTMVPPGDELVAAIENFVRSGGGLITTHDAVGYRGQPPLLTDICVKGVEHVKDARWVVVTEHPVTKGIPVNQPLPQSYYDHIELECGPKGTVLARAAESKRPVVVCGESGKGRYVACGLALGLESDNKETPPSGPEKLLLENAVRWCGRLHD